MTRELPMSVHNHWWRTVALVLVVTIPAALGAYCLAAGGWYMWLAAFIFHGPLLLIALWSALSNTPFYLRWPCGFLALWAANPQLGPAFAAQAWPNYVWRTTMAWQVVPQVLLTFTLLSVLREFGLRLEPRTFDSPRPVGAIRRRFTLRRLFAWVAGAAVLSLAWKNVFAVVLGQAATVGEIVRPPSLPSWQMVADGMISGLSLTAIDLIAVGTVLRPGRMRWRFALLAIVVAASQTLIWQYAVRAPVGLTVSWHALNADAERIRIYDRCCLCPMLIALLLVRSGGYRWTTSRTLSLQHPR